jgi:hypothetical protein
LYNLKANGKRNHHGGRNICLELFNQKRDTGKWSMGSENVCRPHQAEKSLEGADSKEERN